MPTYDRRKKSEEDKKIHQKALTEYNEEIRKSRRESSKVIQGRSMNSLLLCVCANYLKRTMIASLGPTKFA